MRRHLITALLILTAGSRDVLAQTSPDSVAIWTSQLLNGTSDARAAALARLASYPPGTLPASATHAMISELRRLNVALLASPAPWSDDATGEYYMSLVVAVAAVDTPDAWRALVPSIGVSLGVARRVARLGDEAVPALRDLVNRSYEKDVAIGTLGLVSFWADSTGAPLSTTSRSDILQAFLQAYSDTADAAQLGLMIGLRNAKDPTLLPLARALQAKARAGGDLYTANSLTEVITALDVRNHALSLADLMRVVQHNMQAICGRPMSGHGASCQGIQAQIIANVQHVQHGETQAARTGFASVLSALDQARADGWITVAEHILIVGGIQELLLRLG